MPKGSGIEREFFRADFQVRCKTFVVNAFSRHLHIKESMQTVFLAARYYWFDVSNRGDEWCYVIEIKVVDDCVKFILVLFPLGRAATMAGENDFCRIFGSHQTK